MRRNHSWYLWAAVLALTGCGSSFGPQEDSLIDAVTDLSGDGSSALPAASSLIPSTTGDAEPYDVTVSGSVRGTGAYQLFELGPAAAGDDWIVSTSGSSVVSGFTLVLFDGDQDLLLRGGVTSRNPLRHIVRADTPNLVLGVMPAGAAGGDFQFSVTSRPGETVPSPNPQVVYLNFGPGAGVVVHQRSGISFDAFDATELGKTYAGQTQAVKDAILATMREDYAPYNVVIVSSDESPPPAGEYSTVHFGGLDGGLLGLADSVDMYNQKLEQVAVVYVESFAPYAVMQLEPDEMGVMIGNVASHELGHLLGLYHTKDPTEVMDSTGSAWDLAGAQAFHRGPLEDSVFPTGSENSPRLLEQAVGQSGKTATQSKALNTAKALRYRQIRAFVREEMPSRCGLCIDPDE